MTRRAQDVVEQIKALPDTEKLAVVDSILYELDKPDPVIDRVWADEAKTRWRAYRQGRADHVSYAEPAPPATSQSQAVSRPACKLPTGNWKLAR
jgi:hypothetical protein